jgi:hypothetical protein
MAKAYLAGHYTLKQVGQHFAASYPTVSRAVKQIECDMKDLSPQLHYYYVLFDPHQHKSQLIVLAW